MSKYKEFFSEYNVYDFQLYLNQASIILKRLEGEPDYYKKELLAQYISDICNMDYETAFDSGYELALEHVEDDGLDKVIKKHESR